MAKLSINGGMMKESVAHRVVVSFRISGHADGIELERFCRLGV